MKDASQSTGTCHNFVAQSFLLFPPVLSLFLSPLILLSRFPFPVTILFLLQHSFSLAFSFLLLTIFPFLFLQLYPSVSFLFFAGGWFLFHPFPQPPLEVNESRRLSSFTRHRFHVGRRRRCQPSE